VPVLATAVAGAAVWRVLGTTGALVAASLTAAALVGWSAWGAPAWRSRIARRIGPRAPVPFVVWSLLAVSAVVAAIVGAAAREPDAATAWAWTAIGLGEVAIAVTAAGVRQWRFARSPRRIGAATTISAAGVLLALGAPLTVRGSAWGPVVVGTTMVAAGCVARAPARRVREQRVAARDQDRAR
jgi:hypothetical protein